MTLLARPPAGSKATDVSVRLKTDKKIMSHSGSNPSELAARVKTDGGNYIDSTHAVEFADAVKGPPGPPGPLGPAGPPSIYIGPTPPSSTNVLWVDTS